MYKLYPSLVLGFHACDQETGKKVLAGRERLKPSQNEYDWLGHGVYFWENSPDRALDWAESRKSRGRIRKPFVIGAVIALGRCFDLLEYDSLRVLREAHKALVGDYERLGIADQLPKNTKVGGSKDLLNRRLDCAVIEYLHQLREASGNNLQNRPFDSVRGAFWEGDDLYPGAGFKEKNHVQICVRNPNCIKGYFRPLKIDESHLSV